MEAVFTKAGFQNFLSLPEEKGPDPIDSLNKKLSKAVCDCIEEGNIPLVLGGDHSISWGAISGALKCYPDLKVIYLDAHTDCNSFEGSLTKNVHGMHMSFLMGLGEKEYSRRYNESVLDASRIIYAGTRSMDPFETALAEENHFEIIPVDGNEARVMSFISDTSHVYVSLDLDILDPSIFPGTGVPVEGGYSLERLSNLLRAIMNTGKTVSLDIVEYNPLLDPEGKSEKIIEILSALYCSIEPLVN